MCRKLKEKVIANSSKVRSYSGFFYLSPKNYCKLVEKHMEYFQSSKMQQDNMRVNTKVQSSTRVAISPAIYVSEDVLLGLSLHVHC